MSAVPRPHLLGGLAGIVGPVLYVGTWAVLGASLDGYDAWSQAISVLGAIGAPTRWAMSAAFVAFGLLGLPFARSLRAVLPGRATAVAVAAAVCGLATVGAAALPCSSGCPGPGTTPTDTGHSVVAVVGYAALMATPLLTWRHLDRRIASGVDGQEVARWTSFARWSLVAGLAGTALAVVWVLGLFGAAGGLGQRLFNTLVDVWWVAAGVQVLRGPTGGWRAAGSPHGDGG